VPDPSTLGEIPARIIGLAPSGKKVKPGRGRLSAYAVAKFSVYGIFVVLVCIAVWAWISYILGQFTPNDTAFLAAESTLLLAAAAILVIVFEIERTWKPKPKRPDRRPQIR
jgi:hypothetical protein